MKKKMWLLVSAAMIFLGGCSSDSAEQAVKELYENNYTYQKTTIRGEEEDSGYKIVTAGKVTNSPYEEYYKIMEGTDKPAYDEVYCYGDGEEVTARYGIDGKWVEQKQKRNYPYGYDQELKLRYKGMDFLDGAEVKVYAARYKVPISYGLYEGEKEVTAKVEQEYYIGKESGQVQRIITDLTDLNEKKAKYQAETGGPVLPELEVDRMSDSYEEIEIMDIL